MPVIEITSLDFPEVSVYSRLTERQLRSADADGNGIFIAESPKVIRVALRAGYEPLSFLCERRHIDGDAADIIKQLWRCACLYGRPRTAFAPYGL